MYQQQKSRLARGFEVAEPFECGHFWGGGQFNADAESSQSVCVWVCVCLFWVVKLHPAPPALFIQNKMDSNLNPPSTLKRPEHQISGFTSGTSDITSVKHQSLFAGSISAS